MVVNPELINASIQDVVIGIVGSAEPIIHVIEIYKLVRDRGGSHDGSGLRSVQQNRDSRDVARASAIRVSDIGDSDVLLLKERLGHIGVDDDVICAEGPRDWRDVPGCRVFVLYRNALQIGVRASYRRIEKVIPRAKGGQARLLARHRGGECFGRRRLPHELLRENGLR
jgi:hypothetical protein